MQRLGLTSAYILLFWVRSKELRTIYPNPVAGWISTTTRGSSFPVLLLAHSGRDRVAPRPASSYSLYTCSHL
jgi:hypothetical protein